MERGVLKKWNGGRVGVMEGWSNGGLDCWNSCAGDVALKGWRATEWLIVNGHAHRKITGGRA